MLVCFELPAARQQNTGKTHMAGAIEISPLNHIGKGF